MYASLFNNRAIMDVYDEHPDLWAVPVKVLVVANRMFEEALQPWITWKTEKGFYMDVNYTDEIGTTAAAIKTFITNKYNEGVANGQAPTFLIIVGDKPQVPESQMGSATHKVTDLYYYAVAGNDVFGDMYHSRFTCETVAELNNALAKSMMYEQYTMPDPTYLSNVLLIAGWDSGWNPRVGKPTIQYASNYYYNADHGYVNVYEFLQQPYTNPYANLNTGVQFVNYTAHGGETSWSEPSFSVSMANALTNSGKPFLAMGNCCLAADWGYSTKSLGETLLIGQDKGAYAYIGAPVETYWWEDYYFGVGATSVSNQMPTFEQTTMGSYDGVFREDYNCVDAIPFVGNLAVAYGHANGYQGSVTDQYYWEAYHVLGDASICPYHVNPIANTVQHLPTLPIGMNFYTVTADPGSYVGISKDGVLYGAGEIGPDGVADIPIEPVTSSGNAKIVVTHPQRQPYIAEVPAASMNGAYIAFDNYSMNMEQANYNETIDLSIILKNVGTQPSGDLSITLDTENEYVEILNNEGTLTALTPDQFATVEGFQFSVAEDVPDMTKAMFHLTITDGTETWESNFNIVLHAPVLALDLIEQVSGHTGEYLNFTFKNTGSAPFYGGELTISSCSPELAFDPANIIVEDTVDGGQTLMLSSTYTVAESVNPASSFEVAYNFTSGLFEIEDIYILTYQVRMVDFENGFGEGWTFSQDNAWTIVNGGSKGTHCAKSANAGINSSDYSMTLTVDVLAAGDMTFMFKVSSEGSYDKLRFYMDNQQKSEWSGEIPWTQYTQPITVGSHTFKWEYHKDSSVSSGDDCAMVDDIIFPIVYSYGFIAPATDLVADVVGSDVTLTWVASADAEQYVVKRDGETLATVTETSYMDSLPKDGIYTYSVYAENGNGQLSMPVSVTVEAEFDEVGEASETRVSVYPNPANSVLNIVSADSFEYRLINSTGQEVAVGAAQGVKQINVSNLSKGVYFLHLTTGTKVDTQKIVVE